ncbi:MAG TPA: sigma 54-interacting transcriptional regulator [Negativicutes bacterium]
MTYKENFCAENFLLDLITQIENQSLHISEHKKIVAGLKRSLQTLEEAKELDFREIGNHLYDGIYIADGNGKTLYINDAYTRITGIQLEEVIGKYVGDMVSNGLYKNAVTPAVISSKRQVNSMGESLKNGTQILITGSPIFDKQGNVKKVVVVDREMTDLLKMKADLETSQKQIKAVEKDKNKSKLEIEHLRKFHLNKNFLGNSLETQRVIQMIQQVANLDVTILITGETGTGKEVVSNEIYMNSLRKCGPFIKLNCAAIPANLLEAELFGYAKGAFTGATNSGKVGMFELADKGTLLLDEIGEMPMELQSKLLRVIQHKEITRIGGTKSVTLDIRILAATNCNLKELCKQGRFREDLYYRLNVFPINIPPLRERLEDIAVLTQHFLDVYNLKYGKRNAIESSGIDMLRRYSWPGNIRELQNIIERLVIVSDPNAIITKEQIGILLNIHPSYMIELGDDELGLKDIVENIERQTIEKALSLGGSTRKAAKILKIDQSTVVKKAKKLGIVIKDERMQTRFLGSG